VPKVNRQMLQLWSSRAACLRCRTRHFAERHAGVPAKSKAARAAASTSKSAAVRAQIRRRHRSALGLGIAGVQARLRALSDEPRLRLAAASTRRDVRARRFSRALLRGGAANTSRWSPAYLKQVSQLLTQIDPLYTRE